MAHAIGPVVILVGPIGAAAVAKVASNMLAFLNMAGGVEVKKVSVNTVLTHFCFIFTARKY